MLIIANVATNGAIFALTTKRPAIPPTALVTSNARMDAPKELTPPFILTAAITVESATIEPTERSMPPVTMTKNCPTAMIETTAAKVSTFPTFLLVRK